jgi:peptide-methionine (S)-S-oxide reductase
MDDNNDKKEIAVFGGGCFWCTEAVFKMLKGVSKVLPGYSGGKIENPTYEEVSSGKTGHAEVVYLEFDPKVVLYRTLLTVFFGSHDPTTLNRQGADFGTQYRSVVFYTNERQKIEVEKFIEEINASNKDGESVKTEVLKFDKFYEAEDYHKNYFETHPGNPYCEIVINPKLEKVKEKFADILKSF